MLNDLSPIVVTGGAGFIGSNFILHWLASVGSPVVNVDKLTYAGNLQNLTSIERNPVTSSSMVIFAIRAFSTGCSISISHARSSILPQKATSTDR